MLHLEIPDSYLETALADRDKYSSLSGKVVKVTLENSEPLDFEDSSVLLDVTKVSVRKGIFSSSSSKGDTPRKCKLWWESNYLTITFKDFQPSVSLMSQCIHFAELTAAN
jgi:hypothetical protein